MIQMTNLVMSVNSVIKFISVINVWHLKFVSHNLKFISIINFRHASQQLRHDLPSWNYSLILPAILAWKKERGLSRAQPETKRIWTRGWSIVKMPGEIGFLKVAAPDYQFRWWILRSSLCPLAPNRFDNRSFHGPPLSRFYGHFG